MMFRSAGVESGVGELCRFDAVDYHTVGALNSGTAAGEGEKSVRNSAQMAACSYAGTLGG